MPPRSASDGSGYFARSAAWAEESPVLGNAAVDLKWVYVGEACTGSGSHVDCNMTSAWLWCAAGEKEWRCVHAQDSDALLATNVYEWQNKANAGVAALPLNIAAEVQLIYKPYLERGRKLSHLPYKVVRCAAPSELARDAGGKRAVGERQREAQRVCGEIVEGLLAARSG